MNQQSTTGDSNLLDQLKQLEQTTAPQQHANGVCPSCGYCPHCGRGGYGTYPWIVPTYPVYPSPWWQSPYTWCSGGGAAQCDTTGMVHLS